MKPISIIDTDYKQWLQDLSSRFRQSQIKAAVKVNGEVLRFYWELGKDILTRDAENKYGKHFYEQLSKDLNTILGGEKTFSVTTLKYCKYFYQLYSPIFLSMRDSAFRPQLVDNSNVQNRPQLVDKSENVAIQQDSAKYDFTSDLLQHIENDLFSIPWGHHRLIIDKYKNNLEKAFFYVRQTVENGWSRAMLQNFMETALYERQGKALNNFNNTLPALDSDLAEEITKDPYNFAFTGLTKPYNERKLKDALLQNITTFLTELGTGFAYVGKEYRLPIGETENFIDLLFYNLNLSCYVVIEVKIGKFEFGDAGQLGGYVVACNHLLRKEGRDNPTIGLLICKEKDRIQAQYALEASTQPIAISEYELEKFYPTKVEGTIPTIEEIEKQLEKRLQA